MSDGQGPTPETPSGWSAEQPPPFSAPPASPWTAPGSGQIGGQIGGQGPGPQPGPQAGPQTGPQTGPQQPYPPQQPYQHGYQQPYQQQPGPGWGQPAALRPGIIPLRPLGLGDILDGTIKLIRSNPKAVLGLSAVAALLVSVPVAVGQAFLFGSLDGVLRDPAAAESRLYSASGLLSQYGGTGISYLVTFVVVTLLTGVITRILGRAVFGGKITAGEAWRLTKGRIPALFGVVALTGLILLAPLALFAVLLVLMVTAAVASDEPSGLVGPFLGLTVLFVLLYIAYVLFFRTRFAFAAPAVVLEGRGPVDAMRRSWRLVTGDFWRVLGILLLTSLLVGLVSAVLALPFTFAGTLFGMLGAGSAANALVAAVLLAIGGMLSAMLSYPFEAGVSGLLYADRRMRSEAFDLVLQTAAIEQQRQGWVHGSADELWHPSNSAGS
ncbi:glycerophosphoryl diester phosphodiesterase membrane domain-containing protein [Nonomuraea pusilla]|uniref:glycerophosphoryl diester phosphodiesterase membrane domain-containing protein n=1 Tax=Nonomuraea pusilla TaxID=46177 RepID=UPI00331D5C34